MMAPCILPCARRSHAGTPRATGSRSLAPGCTPSAAAGSGSSIHQLGCTRRRAAGSLERRRDGGERARLAVEAGKVAANHVRPHLGVARREAEPQHAAVARADGGDAAVEDHPRGLCARSCRRAPAARTRRRRTLRPCPPRSSGDRRSSCGHPRCERTCRPIPAATDRPACRAADSRPTGCRPS